MKKVETMNTADAIRIVRDLRVGSCASGDNETLEALELAETALMAFSTYFGMQTALMAFSTYFGMQVEDKTGCAYCRHRDEEPFNYPCYTCKRNTHDYFEAE